jgi:glycosyltransferase involved in cell wall biosynthesis
MAVGTEVRAVRVLHVCSFYRPLGGAEKLLFDVLDLLESHGIENAVVAPEAQSGGRTGRRREYFVDYLEYPFSRADLSTAIRDNRRLVRIIRAIVDKERPDVIHLHNQQNPFVYHACASAGIPMVRNVHDPRLYCPTHWRLLPDRSLCPYPVGRACVREGCLDWTPGTVKHVAALIFGRHLSLKNTTLIIESQESYRLALQNGYREEQLCLIPNFTTLRPLDEELAEKERHQKPGQKNVLFVGRASYEKGLHLLLRAMAHVRSDCSLHLLTAGDYFERSVEPLIRSLGLTSRVHVKLGTGYAETARYYSLADVVVVPSVWFETFCLVGIEAFSHLTPVVGTRTGGISDWCVDGETGFLVDLYDEAGMGQAIDRLLTNPEMARQFGLNGYRSVEQHYTGNIYFERLSALYERVVANGEGPSHRHLGVARRAVQPRPGVPGGGTQAEGP